MPRSVGSSGCSPRVAPGVRIDAGGNGVPTKIGSANMDGTKATVLVKGGLEQPEFLTVDIQKEILYFSSSHNPKIESCNLDGTNR